MKTVILEFINESDIIICDVEGMSGYYFINLNSNPDKALMEYMLNGLTLDDDSDIIAICYVKDHLIVKELLEPYGLKKIIKV